MLDLRTSKMPQAPSDDDVYVDSQPGLEIRGARSQRPVWEVVVHAREEQCVSRYDASHLSLLPSQMDL